MSKRLYVATGAFSCGKTTTLRHLAAEYGYTVCREAPAIVLEELGARAQGHPTDQGFRAVLDPGHLCPVCRPLEFSRLVLERQARLEAEAPDGAILERGYLDPIEYYLRKTGGDAYPAEVRPARFAHYEAVFVFAVVPEAQTPRWEKTREERTAEAGWINQRLLQTYRSSGFRCHIIGPGAVEERAEAVHRLILEGV